MRIKEHKHAYKSSLHYLHRLQTQLAPTCIYAQYKYVVITMYDKFP